MDSPPKASVDVYSSRRRAPETVETRDGKLRLWLDAVAQWNLEHVDHLICGEEGELFEKEHDIPPGHVSLVRLTHFELHNTTILLLPQQIKLFAPFQDKLLKITLSGCKVSTSMLVALVHYFPILECLRLEGHIAPDLDKQTPPPLEVLSIEDHIEIKSHEGTPPSPEDRTIKRPEEGPEILSHSFPTPECHRLEDHFGIDSYGRPSLSSQDSGFEDHTDADCHGETPPSPQDLTLKKLEIDSRTVNQGILEEFQKLGLRFDEIAIREAPSEFPVDLKHSLEAVKRVVLVFGHNMKCLRLPILPIGMCSTVFLPWGPLVTTPVGAGISDSLDLSTCHELRELDIEIYFQWLSISEKLAFDSISSITSTNIKRIGICGCTSPDSPARGTFWTKLDGILTKLAEQQPGDKVNRFEVQFCGSFGMDGDPCYIVTRLPNFVKKGKVTVFPKLTTSSESCGNPNHLW